MRRKYWSYHRLFSFRSLTPIWEETLVLNEDIQHILQPQSSILILFEILDCVSFDEAIAQYQKLGKFFCNA